mmetsp:Transcript_26856/g.49387  ORF Transcript_26856/g.49387 Transcript_26856/m.49387 type:complete len:200 (-) Transcript_26856:242-841(-)
MPETNRISSANDTRFITAPVKQLYTYKHCDGGAVTNNSGLSSITKKHVTNGGLLSKLLQSCALKRVWSTSGLRGKVSGQTQVHVWRGRPSTPPWYSMTLSCKLEKHATTLPYRFLLSVTMLVTAPMPALCSPGRIIVRWALINDLAPGSTRLLDSSMQVPSLTTSNAPAAVPTRTELEDKHCIAMIGSLGLTHTLASME